MKLIAIEINWYFVIGIAALLISISIMIFWRENISNYFYCNLYTKIFPNQKIPERCKIEENIESIKIFSEDEDEIIRKFTSYLIKCWIEAEKYKNFKTHYCFKISFHTSQDFKIFPHNISKILRDYDNCRTLQFKSYNCGYRDDIIWKVENEYIQKNDIVIIKYLDSNQIEIIA
ncbi:MAG: hypothetical protein QXO40_02530 [Candidatus Aenigmatarchaeota archaeon]